MALFRRFGRPGLLGGITRAAVVAGTATMTARVVGRSTSRPEQNNFTDDLHALDEMHSAGHITDEEFSSAKARLLEE
jgi:hypothetical protein